MRRERRWCCVCFRTRQAKRHQYANEFGVWPLASLGNNARVKVLVKIAFLLERVMPADGQVFLDLVQASDPLEGQAIKPVQMVIWFLVHAIKWPPVVRHVMTLLEGKAIDGIGVVDLVRLFTDAISWARNKNWPTLFKRMNSGLMHAQTGFSKIASDLGLIIEAEETHGTHKRGKSKEETFALGCSPAAKFVVADDGPCLELFQYYIDCASKCEWAWPDSPEEVLPFFDQITRFAKACRSYFTKDGYGLPGGRTTIHEYNVKHFVRGLVLATSALPSTIGSTDDGQDNLPNRLEFDNSTFWRAVAKLPMKTLLKYTPDENMTIDKQLCGMSCLEVRRRLGVSPHLLSCWLCLAGVASDSDVEAAERANLDCFWEVVSDYYKNESDCEDSFPPGPHIIFEKVAEATEAPP